LLEFVTRERWVFDSRFFPFVKGQAEALGCSTRWLCYGADIQTTKTGETSVCQYMDLSAADLATLSHHVQELAPTHVLLSHPVAEGVLEILLQGREDVSVMSTSDHAGPTRIERVWDVTPAAKTADAARQIGDNTQNWMQGRTDWCLHWLGARPASSPHFGRYLVGSVPPSYDAVMANTKAIEYRPHLLILGGVTCDHFHKVSGNPAYEGLDLSSTQHDFGCSYCTWYRGATSELREDPVAVAKAQLQRVLETAGRNGRFCGVLDLLDIRLFSHIDRFVQMAIELGMPPTEFCFEPRVDRVVQVADKLDRALADCAQAGHRVTLFRMGAENLVEEENVLYNKHVSLAEIDGGMQHLQRMAQQHPGLFAYDPTWGYITCGPWTTLEMLETGVRRAIERGFQPGGVWLYTPLLLYRAAPISVLAQEEGLILDAFDDVSLLYNSAANNVSFDSFYAWRFKDERTRVAFALFVRFCAAGLRDKYPDTIFCGDALYAHILKQKPEFDRPDLFALEVMALVKSEAAPYDRMSLLDAALARYRALPSRAPEAQPLPETQPQAEPGQPSEQSQRRAQQLGRVLEVLGKRAGIAISDVRALGDAQVALSVAVQERTYRLTLAAPAEGQRFFFKTKRFGVSHARETPVLAQHVAVLRQLVEGLDAVISGRALTAPRIDQETAGMGTSVPRSRTREGS